MPTPDSTNPRHPGLAEMVEMLDRDAPADRINLDSYHPSPSLKARITLTADGGTEFYFPPMRDAAQASGQTVVFFISLAIWVLYGTAQQQSMFWAAWGLIELLFFLWILRLWFAPERVVIGNGVVSDTYGIFRKTRTIPTAQVAAIQAVPGAYTRHFAILIKDAGFRLFMVGDGIRNWHDAEWLALQMSRTANVKASEAHSSGAAPAAELLEQVQAINALAKDKGWVPMTRQADMTIDGASIPSPSDQTARRSPLMRAISAVMASLIKISP
jgi:hypothetical protein